MRFKDLTAAVVCIAVLYTVDALWFGGAHFAAASRVARDVYAHW